MGSNRAAIADATVARRPPPARDTRPAVHSITGRSSSRRPRRRRDLDQRARFAFAMRRKVASDTSPHHRGAAPVGAHGRVRRPGGSRSGKEVREPRRIGEHNPSPRFYKRSSRRWQRMVTKRAASSPLPVDGESFGPHWPRHTVQKGPVHWADAVAQNEAALRSPADAVSDQNSMI